MTNDKQKITQLQKQERRANRVVKALGWLTAADIIGISTIMLRSNSEITKQNMVMFSCLLLVCMGMPFALGHWSNKSKTIKQQINEMQYKNER